MSRLVVDFGQAAADYAQHRPGFPDAFFDRVRQEGIGLPQQRILEVGCGTGALARGFAQRGCRVVGLDPSPEMLEQARLLAQQQAVPLDLVRACAEATGLAGASFDIVSAGQCWHWFDGHRAAVETHRLLRQGGQALLAYFTYISEPGSLGAASEALILKHNPSWPLAGSDGRMGFLQSHLSAADFLDVRNFEFDIDIPLTHEAWRGRLRACNGVILMNPEAARVFDQELAELLHRDYPPLLQVPHRVFAILGRRGAAD
jgi:SAM-dependent methyltransferase